jgi:hypothetical protein
MALEDNIRSAAHMTCYLVVRVWLKSIFKEATEEDADLPSFITRVGRARIHTDVRAWQNPLGEDDAIVKNVGYIARDVEENLLLTRWLVEKNANTLFGGFAINGNRVFFSHSIVGSTCDRVELRASMLAVADSVLNSHDEVLRRGGGTSALDE